MVVTRNIHKDRSWHKVFVGRTSGMVLMLTTRISSGRSASSGEKCASSISMRVSNST